MPEVVAEYHSQQDNLFQAMQVARKKQQELIKAYYSDIAKHAGKVGSDVIPIEVKSGGVTKAKSIRVFAEKYHSKYRAIFSAKNMHIDQRNKVHYYPLYLARHFPFDLDHI